MAKGEDGANTIPGRMVLGGFRQIGSSLGNFAVGEIGCRWASLGQDIVHSCEQKNERETSVSGFNVAEI